MARENFEHNCLDKALSKLDRSSRCFMLGLVFQELCLPLAQLFESAKRRLVRKSPG